MAPVAVPESLLRTVATVRAMTAPAARAAAMVTRMTAPARAMVAPTSAIAAPATRTLATGSAKTATILASTVRAARTAVTVATEAWHRLLDWILYVVTGRRVVVPLDPPPAAIPPPHRLPDLRSWLLGAIGTHRTTGPPRTPVPNPAGVQ